MKCNQCQAMNEEAAVTCTNCGAALNAETAAAPEVPAVPAQPEAAPIQPEVAAPVQPEAVPVQPPAAPIEPVAQQVPPVQQAGYQPYQPVPPTSSAVNPADFSKNLQSGSTIVKIGKIAALAGFLLCLLSCVLPFVTVGSLGSVFLISRVGDGIVFILTILFSLAGTALCILAIMKKDRMFVLISAGLAFLAFIFFLASKGTISGMLGYASAFASAGVGFIFALLGSLAAIAGSVIYLLSDEPKGIDQIPVVFK